MDTFFRTRIVTSARQRFIACAGTNVDKFYVVQNLGPAKVTIYFSGTSGGEASNDIRSGDFYEMYCCWADIQLATGESLDAAVIQWQPAS